MTDLRDTDPELPPVKTPAELAAEDRKVGARLEIFGDRYGSPWLVVPVCIALVVALWKFLFSEKSCPKTKT